MSDPAVPRMPPPNRLAFAAGILLVVGSLVIASREPFRLLILILCWTAFVGSRIRHSPFARSWLRRHLARLNAPAPFVTLHAKWNGQAILAVEVATSDEIAAFERANGVALPKDLRYYFAFVNGTLVGECGKDDEHGVGFWHLSDIRSFGETRIGAEPDAARTFAFADFSMRTAVYGVRLGADPTQATPVFASMPSGRVQVAASFSEFVERYLLNPRSVLFPEFDVVAVEEGIGTERDGIFTCSIRWQDVKALSIVLAASHGGAVQAAWMIAGDEPVSPLLALFVPVVLSARSTEVTKRLRALPGFDEDAFRAAVAAEHRDETGTFVCWRCPDLRDDPSMLAARSRGDACVARVGPAEAGHYVNSAPRALVCQSRRRCP